MSERARPPAVAQVSPVHMAEREIPDGQYRLQRHCIAGVTAESREQGQPPKVAGFQARVAVQSDHFNRGSGGADAGLVTVALTNVQQRANELHFDTFETHNVVERAPEGRFGMSQHTKGNGGGVQEKG